MYKLSVELYKTASRQWRWRVRDARNKLIIAAATESYVRLIDARRNITRVLGLVPPAVKRGSKFSELTYLVNHREHRAL